MYRDVLVVAPDAGLPDVEAEVRGIGDALRPVSLRNGVTVRDVTERIARQSWDIIWFACHGDAKGIQLTDGPLDTATLVPLVRTAGAKVIVLNTCESDQVAIYLWALTGAAVVCTVVPVPDKAAYVTGRLLAEALGKGLDIKAAFARSRPGDVGQTARYRLWDGEELQRTTDTDALMAATVRAVTAANLPLMQRLDAQDRAIAQVQASVAAANTRREMTRQRRLLWLAGVMLTFLPFLAADALFANGLFLPWWLGLAAAVICMGVGLWLIGQGNGMLS